MLARGEHLSEVLASFLGQCSGGRAALGIWLSYLATFPTRPIRRAVLEHFLRSFEGAQRHGTMWRVIGAEGFVGRQHVPAVREQIDPMTGEVTPGASYPRDPDRRHCPAESAGGIAAHSDRAPRTLSRYRQSLREGGILASRQPPKDARDAVKPRTGDGRWAYTQIWLALPPTPEMIRRWRGRRRQPAVRASPCTQRTFTAARPPRVDELLDLSDMVERLY